MAKETGYTRVHHTGTFRRRIGVLRKSGAVGAQAAQKAEDVVRRLARGGIRRGSSAFGLVTRHGERRLKKCRKYDLGGGFRLITILRESTLHVAYVGSHDECDRWLARNSKLSGVPMSEGKIVPVARVPENREDRGSGGADTPKPQASDSGHPEPGGPDLSDRDLRRIFRGLVRARRKGPARNLQP